MTNLKEKIAVWRQDCDSPASYDERVWQEGLARACDALEEEMEHSASLLIDAKNAQHQQAELTALLGEAKKRIAVLEEALKLISCNQGGNTLGVIARQALKGDAK